MMNFRICAAVALAVALAASPVMAQQKELRLIVINGTGVAIEYFYFAGCGGGEWGRDRLGAKELIEPGARRSFSFRISTGKCCHDLRAKLHTGASRQKLNADLCRDAEWIVQ
jgi:hypothetical protein